MKPHFFYYDCSEKNKQIDFIYLIICDSDCVCKKYQMSEFVLELCIGSDLSGKSSNHTIHSQTCTCTAVLQNETNP